MSKKHWSVLGIINWKECWWIYNWWYIYIIISERINSLLYCIPIQSIDHQLIITQLIINQLQISTVSEPPGPYRESDASSDSSTDETAPSVDLLKPLSAAASGERTSIDIRSRSLPISAASSQGSVAKHPLLLGNVRSNSLPIAELPSPPTISQQVSEADSQLLVSPCYYVFTFPPLLVVFLKLYNCLGGWCWLFVETLAY